MSVAIGIALLAAQACCFGGSGVARGEGDHGTARILAVIGAALLVAGAWLVAA